jgi:hypothetical protein
MVELSVVVPVFNEEKTFGRLANRFYPVSHLRDYDFSMEQDTLIRWCNRWDEEIIMLSRSV